jgi:phospho-N-acetylmuramoyl-pentapeptide-transferase
MLFGLVGVQSALSITNGPLLMSQIIAGATLPFLFWNAPKARVFMGDVGSLAIGSFLGASFFAGTRSSTPMAIPPYGYLALFLWSFVMIAELVPVPLQIASVKLRKKKLFPYTPIHHAFEKAGWPETRVVFMFVIVQVCCSVAAQQLGQLQQLETMVAVSNR